MHLMLTVDGSSSTDLDDGFFIQPTDQGGWLLTIYIAAPASQMPFNSDVVKQAETRAATQYAGKSIVEPMISDDEINKTCSLLPGVARPVIALTISISDTGEALRQDLTFQHQAQSVGKLDYISFGEALHDPNNPHHEQAKWATDCARKLFYTRICGDNSLGILDENTGTYTDEEGHTRTVSLREIHGQIVVQEFMILNNRIMAEWASEQALPIIYRNHTPYCIDSLKDSHPEMHKALIQMDIEVVNKLKSQLLQPAAFSMCNEGHIGLGLDVYSTFSSPLRRFPDLYNQYVVLSVLNGSACPVFTEARCEAINNHLNELQSSRKSLMKEYAGFSAMKALRTNGRLTPNQFSQVIKRHPLLHEKEKACRYFLTDVSLHANVQTWSSLIMHPLPLPRGMAKKMMAIFDKNMVGQSVWHHLHTVLGFQANEQLSEYNEECFRALTMQSLGLNAKHETNSSPDGETAAVASTPIPQENANSTTDYERGTNYKGAVLERCQRLGQHLPDVKVTNIGASHLPVWVASLSPALPGSPDTITCRDTSKKGAESRVYHQVLSFLPEIKMETAPDGLANDNPKSYLNQYCQQHKLQIPVYNTQQGGNDFDCTVSVVVGSNQALSGKGVGKNKKSAEQAAAADVIKKLA